jgi:hypothetical protein
MLPALATVLSISLIHRFRYELELRSYLGDLRKGLEPGAVYTMSEWGALGSVAAMMGLGAISPVRHKIADALLCLMHVALVMCWFDWFWSRPGPIGLATSVPFLALSALSIRARARAFPIGSAVGLLLLLTVLYAFYFVAEPVSGSILLDATVAALFGAACSLSAMHRKRS